MTGGATLVAGLGLGLGGAQLVTSGDGRQVLDVMSTKDGGQTLRHSDVQKYGAVAVAIAVMTFIANSSPAAARLFAFFLVICWAVWIMKHTTSVDTALTRLNPNHRAAPSGPRGPNDKSGGPGTPRRF